MMTCPRCRREVEGEEKVCPGCGLWLGELSETRVLHSAPAEQALDVPHAGFWRRFVAYLIDGFIVRVAIGILAIISLEPGGWAGLWGVFATAFMLPWLYWAGMESSPTQATLGKMIVGITVTDLQGKRLSFLHATGRFLGKYASVATLGIGFMMAGVTEQKQALHDLLAGTLVVKRAKQKEFL